MKMTFRIACMFCLIGTGLIAAEVGADVYAKAAACDYTANRVECATIEEEIRNSKSDQFKTIEAKLLDALKAPNASFDGKKFLLRQLAIVGSAQAVPAIAACLADEKLNHEARFGLESIQDPSAVAALRQSLGQLKGNAQLGVISSLGMRRDADSVSTLAGLAQNTDSAIAEAAITALGDIGTLDAAKALEKVQAPESLQRALFRARLSAADRLVQAGKKSDAAGIYQSVLKAASVPAFRIAALKGLVNNSDRSDAVKLIADAVQGTDAALKTAAASTFYASKDVELQKDVIKQLPSFTPTAQLILLPLVADLRTVSARESLIRIAKEGSDSNIKAAALEALAVHGSADDVDWLVGLAAQKKDPESAAAVKALENIYGPQVNAALEKLANGGDTAKCAVALAVSATRGLKTAIPALLKQAAGTDPVAAAAALKSIENIGGVEELPPLAALQLATTDNAVRGAVEKTTIELCRNAQEKDACARVYVPAYEKAASNVQRISIMKVLQSIRCDSAMAVVLNATKSSEKELSDVAIRILADWPEMNAVPKLLELAKATTNDVHGVLALRGVMRLAGQKDSPPAERLRILRAVLDTAKRVEEKKQALAGVADVPSKEALELLRGYFKEDALVTDACQASIRLVGFAGSLFQKEAIAAMTEVKGLPAGAKLAAKADEAVAQAKGGKARGKR